MRFAIVGGPTACEASAAVAGGGGGSGCLMGGRDLSAAVETVDDGAYASCRRTPSAWRESRQTGRGRLRCTRAAFFNTAPGQTNHRRGHTTPSFIVARAARRRFENLARVAVVVVISLSRRVYTPLCCCCSAFCRVRQKVVAVVTVVRS